MASWADHRDALPVASFERISERVLDCEPQPADVRAVEGVECRDGTGVGTRMAIALLHLRRDHDHLLGDVCDGAVGFAGDEPNRPAKRLGGLERQGGRTLVADTDEEVPLGRTEHGLERLVCFAACLRSMKRGAAAREDDASVREAPVPDALWNAAQPLRLRLDRLAGQFSGHLGARR